MAIRRLVFDLTSLARWTGPPVGIVRAQQMLARYAVRERSNVVFSLFDPDRQCYREVSHDSATRIIDRSLIVEMSMLGSPTGLSRRLQDRLSPRWRSCFYWCTKTRRKLLYWAEDLRASATNHSVQALANRLVTLCAREKDRERLFGANGERRECAAFHRVAGKEIDLSPDDATLAAQFDWAHTNVARLAELKQRIGFRHFILCYDIIPILFPEWYHAHDVKNFQAYYDRALGIADGVVVNSQKIERDVRDYASNLGRPNLAMRMVPLGADPPKSHAKEVPLPQGLEADRYVLFVSTIEPRKNHAMLIEVWRRLVREQTPQQHRFQLVFVGRPGWKMDDFIPRIQRDEEIADTVKILHNVDDATLAQLYRSAGFCVYPPIYEGFGLPAIEALSYGKPLLASQGGSVPEVVGDAAPCLDPLDQDAWYTAMRRWIVDGEARHAAGRQSLLAPAPLTWDESAQRLFQTLDELADLDRSPSSLPHWHLRSRSVAART